MKMKWELMPSKAFYDEHPWKLVCGTDYNGEPLILASVGGYSGGDGKEHWSWVSDWPFTLIDEIDDRSYPTREAAMQAAEKAVKEWFRAALGEPVAWYARGTDPIDISRDRIALEEAHYTDSAITPLYALEADE